MTMDSQRLEHWTIVSLVLVSDFGFRASSFWRGACFSFIAAAACLAAFAGCGPTIGSISGTVTAGGQPIENGIISFSPTDGKGAPITVDIKAGQYSAQGVVAGPKQVQISAPVVTGRRPEYNGPDAPMVEITEESIPAKYNTDSTLTFDLKPGANQKDWTVETNKRK
jgi:hypothetical protein